MRGWAPRTLGPGNTPAEESAFPVQMGDMRLEANAELRFPIWGMFHGATFVDVGNVWYLGRDKTQVPADGIFHIDKFYKQLGMNTGLGLRIDIQFVILRLDWGIQIHNPNREGYDQIVAPGGALEALLEAKAAGKIGHIGFTNHYAEMIELVLQEDWVETVMFPYNIVETQGEALMRRAAEQGVGFVCMKPLAGGALEDATLALRFIAANPDSGVIIPGMYDEKEIAQNLAAIEDKAPLSEAELGKIDAIRRELGTQFCRRCNYCQPCPQGIGIAGIFVLEGYLSRYGLEDWAKLRYNATPKKAGDCIGCGACETRCPYQLPIRQMLARCREEFGA